MWMIELAMNTITADSEYRQPECGNEGHGVLPMMR